MTILPTTPYRGTLPERVQTWRKTLAYGLRTGLIVLFVAGPGQIIKWRLRRKQGAGETVWLDDLTFGKRDTPAHNPAPEQSADIAPNTDVPDGLGPSRRYLV